MICLEQIVLLALKAKRFGETAGMRAACLYGGAPKGPQLAELRQRPGPKFWVQGWVQFQGKEGNDGQPWAERIQDHEMLCRCTGRSGCSYEVTIVDIVDIIDTGDIAL